MSDIKKEIADEAVGIVNGTRRTDYGSPENNFRRIARFWNAYLTNIGFLSSTDCDELEAKDVAAMMRLMKEARLAQTPDHRDSYVDLVGYALCGAEVAPVARVRKNNAEEKTTEEQKQVSYPPFREPHEILRDKMLRAAKRRISKDPSPFRKNRHIQEQDSRKETRYEEGDLLVCKRLPNRFNYTIGKEYKVVCLRDGLVEVENDQSWGFPSVFDETSVNFHFDRLPKETGFSL